ncbi:MAG: hypothetical protein NTX61_14810, partial [Bacteroidetes bacterium]|nr:hypothetical protein [Bacteroidota bacterium]
MVHRYLAFLFFFSFLAPCQLHPANKPTFKTSSVSAFIENKGQIVDQNYKPNPGVLYLLNTPGMNVQLRRGGFSYDLYQVRSSRFTVPSSQSTVGSNSSHVPSPMSQPSDSSTSINYHRIDIDLQNANLNATIETSAPSTDYVNYYTKGTPTNGVTSVRSFSSVTYKNIYPGIDLQFISNNERLFEYNFILQPGADIASIKLKISGPKKIKKFRDGIQMKTTIGDVEEEIPMCFYLLNHQKIPVKGRFREIGTHVYGFSMDQVIPLNAILEIDPVPARKWGTYYGGNITTDGFEIPCFTDGAGNIIIAGSTNSVNNIATSGAYQETMQGNNDAFIAKFSPDGQRLWGTYYGGSSSEAAYCCNVDHDNNIIIGGFTSSTNNIASPGAWQTVLHGDGDAMLAKFTPGGQRIWGTYYGGNEIDPWTSEYFEACGADTNGNIYCSGVTSSPDFIASPGAHQTTIGGMSDDFLVKFTPDGQRVWGTYYGGNNLDQNGCSAVSKDGFVFLSGNTHSPNNIATPGSFLPNLVSDQSTFLSAFDPTGQRLWGTYYGGYISCWNYGCAIDTGSNVYIFGNTSDVTGISTPGVFQENLNVGNNGFLTKFSSAGNRLWGSYYGANHTDILGAAVDDSGYVFISGNVNSQNSVIPSPGAFQTVFRGGGWDAFLGKMTSNGQRVWGTYYGGTDTETGLWCTVDKNDNVYLCGEVWSTNNSNYDTALCYRTIGGNYIATPGSFQSEKAGFRDVYLVKFADCYSPDTVHTISGSTEICANTTGVIYSTDPIFAATGYHWCVSGNLTISSGQGTTSITVNVGPVAGTDTISVYGVNSCDNGFPKFILITVLPRPVPMINGPDTVCTGDTAIYYTKNGMSNYLWTFSAGGNLIFGGSSTDTLIKIKWTTGGAKWVRINYTMANGCSAVSPTQKDTWVNTGPAVSITINTTSTTVCTGTQVTFTAAPVNEGSAPVYQWKVNGMDAGTNSPTYSYTPNNGDIITCILTSNIACGSGNPATSNTITIIVEPYVAVSVSITASQNPVCAGTSVTFTATPTNGGTIPSYQWKVNGTGQGTDNPVYSYIPNNGDVVTCVLTSNQLCTTGSPATSNAITMTVNPNLPVSVSINTPDNPFCQGSTVSFTATPTNGGSTPSYQWLVNGTGGWPSAPTMSYSPANGDLVSCVLNSNIACPTGNPATSNTITMVENTVNPVSIVITTPVTTVCSGASVTFTATPTNGGTTPIYQWKVNGINGGTNSNTFGYVPVNGDVVSCALTSNLACASGNPATSNTITMTVNPSLPVSVVITASDNTVCAGTTVTFSATPINGGTTPVYQWRVNGGGVWPNASTMSYTPMNGDQVKCILNSNATCPTGNPVTSNTITMTVTPNLPVSVSITASVNPVCSGIPVTFSAIPTNGGANPTYQWLVNGSGGWPPTTTFTYTPMNADQVWCVLTSNLTCTSGNPATSNTITMGVAASPIVTFTRCNDSITTTVAQPFRLKGGIPLGGNYSGSGVTNGIFYPAISGVGSHQITYSYTNVALCSASAIVTIVTRNALPLICGNPLTDIRDNHAYPTIQIGSQ